MEFIYDRIPNNTVYTEIPNYSGDYNGIRYLFENWIYLNWNGIILNRYLISNYGRLFDLRDMKFVNYSVDKDGYYYASIHVDSIGYKKIRVHRFELLSFYPIPNYKDMVANHKDGNKSNLFINNLEWTTSFDNTRHGWETGLNPNIGYHNGNSYYMDEDIHTFCMYIDEGLTNSEICDRAMVKDSKDRIKLCSTLSGIRKGKSHRNISCKYNFMKDQNLDKRYDLDFAQIVCQYLSDLNHTYTFQELMDVMGVPPSEKIVFRVFITDLLHGRTCKSISRNYVLKQPIGIF